MARRADILMITYRSSGYLDLSLSRLLSTLGPDDRVWLWHNGNDEATLAALQKYLDHPGVHAFHHSEQNVALREPTNWLWSNAEGAYLSKVDDDCLVAPGWIDTLSAAHDDNPGFGAIGSWRGLPEDFQPDLAREKIREFAGGHRLLENLWVQGSGYLIKRSWQQRIGLLGEEDSFIDFCIRMAKTGAVNGFYYPFIPEEHMDDPRTPNTLIRTDEDLMDRMPLSAKANGVRTMADWTDQLRRSALILQTCSLDPKHYEGWRMKLNSIRRRWDRLRGRPARW